MEKCTYKRVMLKISGEALSGANGFVFDFYTGFIRFIDKSKTIRGKVVYNLIIYIVTIALLPVIALSGIKYVITEFIKKNFDINE